MVTPVNTADICGKLLARTKGQPVTTREGVKDKYTLVIETYPGQPHAQLDVLGTELLHKAAAQGVTAIGEKIVVRCKINYWDSGKGYAPMPQLRPYDIMSHAHYIHLQSEVAPALDGEIMAQPVQPQPVVSKEIDALYSQNPASVPPPPPPAVDDDLPF